MKSQINIRASALLQRQLDELTAHLGTSITETVSLAIDRIYQQEINMKYNRRQHKIEKIADLIVGHRLDEATIDATNEVGWTIDIRFRDEQYVNENSWSRVSDIHLDPDELATAKRYAADLEASL